MNSGDTPVLTQDLFQIIFEKSPGSLLVKADKPHFTIIAVSDTYLSITTTKREEIVGKGFFEVFPDDRDFDDATNARNTFTKVIETGEKIEVSTYRYDIFNAETKSFEAHYWSCCNTPISDGANKAAFILIRS